MNDAFLTRLNSSSGAPVDVMPLVKGTQPPRGGWFQVSGDKFFIRVHGTEPIAPTLATIDVDLSSGPYRFVAMLEPVDTQTWRVVTRTPLNSRRSIRLSVALPGKVGRLGAEPDVPVLIHDLSASGVGFDSLTQLDAHQRYQIRLDGKRGERLGTLEGRLIPRTSAPPLHRYGMRLITTADAQARIYEYLFELKVAHPVV